jgi:hypothetical protein
MQQRTMQAMQARTAAGSSPLGYAVVLIGALGFVVGCFLPYADVGAQAEHSSLSLYRLLSLRESALAATGSFLYLFTGVTAIALISLAALREPRAWTSPALVAASIVWSLTWIGILLGGYGFYTSLNAGYWLMLACVCVVVLGAALVFMSSRTRRAVGGDR